MKLLPGTCRTLPYSIVQRKAAARFLHVTDESTHVRKPSPTTVLRTSYSRSRHRNHILENLLGPPLFNRIFVDLTISDLIYLVDGQWRDALDRFCYMARHLLSEIQMIKEIISTPDKC